MRRAVLLLLLPLLAACGGDPDGGTVSGSDAGAATSEPTATVTVTESASASPSAVPDPAEPTGLVAGDDGTWTPWSRGGPAATDLSDIDLPGFTSPTGNLACLFSDRDDGAAEVRCDRREGLGVDEPRPADCSLDWGDAVVVAETGPGGLLCVGDTVFGSPDTDGSRALPYGDSVVYAGLTCTSRREGVQCLNGEGRGFVVSRRAIVTR